MQIDFKNGLFLDKNLIINTHIYLNETNIADYNYFHFVV